MQTHQLNYPIEKIIEKFKRNGQILNPQTLSMTTEYLKSYTGQGDPLASLLTKLNQFTIRQNCTLNEKSLKRVIDLLKFGKNNYTDHITQTKSWSIYYLSPYQNNQSNIFDEKPSKQLFSFNAEDKINMQITKFKAIRNYNRTFYNGPNIFIGVLYQRNSQSGKTQLVLQDETAQVKIQFPKNNHINCFIIPGCTYIVKGNFRDMVMQVNEIILPKPLPPNANSLLAIKFKRMCEQINEKKQSLIFDEKDFTCYQCIYNSKKDKNLPIMVFGNVLVNQININKLYRIVSTFRKILCIVIMLADATHEEINIKLYFPSVQVYIIPHINSEGPRILPKLPLLKNNYGCTLLTNPAKFSIYGKEVIFANYPFVSTLHSKNLKPQKQTQIIWQQLMTRISKFLQSQSDIAIGLPCFWKQTEYLSVNSQTLLITFDKSCSQTRSISEDGNSGIVSTGNFSRDGDFVLYMPKENKSSSIQLCNDSPQQM